MINIIYLFFLLNIGCLYPLIVENVLIIFYNTALLCYKIYVHVLLACSYMKFHVSLNNLIVGW